MSACPERDTPLCQVVGREFYSHSVASQDSDVVLAHFSRNVGRYDVTIIEFDTEHGIRQRINDRAFHFN